MNNENKIGKKYYESQTEPDWERKKSEFESKIAELRQVKQELSSQKKDLLASPKSQFSRNTTVQELQILMALKDEESRALQKIVEHEKEKGQEALKELEIRKSFCADLEKKFTELQGRLIGKEKVLGKCFTDIKGMKVNIQKWLNPSTSQEAYTKNGSVSLSFVSSPRSLGECEILKAEVKRLQNEIEELKGLYGNAREGMKKNRNSDKLNEYLLATHDENEENLKEELEKEVKSLKADLLEKNKEIESFKEQNFSVIADYKEKIKIFKNKLQQYEDQIEELKSNSTDKSYEKNSKSLKEPEFTLEQYKQNIEILMQNNSLLQDRLKALEAENKRLELKSKPKPDSFSFELRKNRPENDSEFKRTFFQLLSQSPEKCVGYFLHEYGEDSNGMFELMKSKLDDLKAENERIKAKLVELPKDKSGLSKKINFQDMSPKHVPNSMSQDVGVNKTVRPNNRRALSKSFSAKKPNEESSSILVVENIVTENDQSKILKPKIGVNKKDLVTFLQFNAAVLEDSLKERLDSYEY